MLISKDGQEWYEVDAEAFQELFDDPQADCWVDLSGEKGFLHVTLSECRKMVADAEVWSILGFKIPGAHLERNGNVISIVRPGTPINRYVQVVEPPKDKTLFGIPIVYTEDVPKLKPGDISLSRPLREEEAGDA